jgi:pyrroline-5-carboxylate reductase
MRENSEHIAFVGGGNMARAILGGLLREGLPPSQVTVVEPFEATAAKLRFDFGVLTSPTASASLADATLVIWAVKPQMFCQAAEPIMPFTRKALHLSVAAGIHTDSITRWLATERVVRCMPNTPALVGQGITALFACPPVSSADKSNVERIVSSTGQFLWVQEESQLDAVTALSGSGPAYVFYFLEAMTAAGTQLGLPADQAYRLAIATFAGSASLAAASSDSPESLRQQVTSKGGTTHAAITSMEASNIKASFVQAMFAAASRAQEMGDEFGKL